MRSAAMMMCSVSANSCTGPAAGADTSKTATQAMLATIRCCDSAAMLMPACSVAGGPMLAGTLCRTCREAYLGQTQWAVTSLTGTLYMNTTLHPQACWRTSWNTAAARQGDRPHLCAL